MSRYERMPWREFADNHWRWKQGEHVLVAAPTSAGKTHATGRILQISHRKNVVIFVSKFKDDIFDKPMFKTGWHRTARWPAPPDKHRVLLCPAYPPGASLKLKLAIQRFTFKHAMDRIMDEGGWCIVFDEQHWLCDPSFLGLRAENAALQHTGRSSGITVWNNTQRPANVPVISYSSAAHAFLGYTNHNDDLKRLAELGAKVDKKQLEREIQSLDIDKHELLYIPVRTGQPPVRLITGR